MVCVCPINVRRPPPLHRSKLENTKKNFEAFKVKLLADEKWAVATRMAFKEAKRKIKELETRNGELESLLASHIPDTDAGVLFQEMKDIGESSEGSEADSDSEQLTSRRKVDPN